MAHWFHHNARGQKLNLDNREWMVKILQETSPYVVIPKSSKTGVSELLFVNCFAWGIQNKNGMYILPTEPVRDRLVKTRIDPIMSRTAFYDRFCRTSKKDPDNNSIKKFFGGMWNFVGSRSPETFYEFDADVLVYDEFDRCDQANLEIAKDRTGAAQEEIWWKVGNPTIAGFGIDAEWQKSSMQLWMLKCEHCNEWHSLDWFKHFVIQAETGWILRHAPSREGPPAEGHDVPPVCSKCGRPFNRLAPGEWVGAHPRRDIAGYQVSRLFGAPGNDLAELAPRPIIWHEWLRWLDAQRDPTSLQLFYNNRLGIPFEAEGTKLTYGTLARCASDYQMPSKMTEGVQTAGVDVGTLLHVHISGLENGIRKKLFVGTVKDWDDLQALCHRMNVARGVVDAQPEQHAAEEWCRTHRNWYRCRYAIANTGTTIAKVDHVKREIQVNRTASLDQSYQQWVVGQVVIPANFATLDHGDFVRQMLAPSRVLDPDRQVFVWDEGGQPDHHFHADNYDRIAASLYEHKPLLRVI